MMDRLTSTGWDGFDRVLGGLPRGGLIIVAGHPGAGKTMLSAKLLYEGAYRYGEPGVYVSFIEDKLRFYSNMRGVGLDFEELERDGRFTYLDLPQIGKLGVSGVAELIIEAVDRLKARRLAIDSFTALAHTFEDEAELRIFVHSVLYRIARDLGCTTILVEEVPIGGRRIGFGIEEFIADDVLILRRRLLDGRPLREVRVVKLRGVDLVEDRFIFTLSDRIKVFPQFSIPEVEGYRFAQPPEDLSKDIYSTGIRDLDRIVGGYRRGSTVVLEVDPRIKDIEYQLSLLLPLEYSFISKCRPLIVVPSLTVAPSDTVFYGKHYFGYSDEKLEELLRIVGVGLGGGEAEHPCLITVEGRDIHEDYRMLLEYLDKFLMGKMPPLTVIGMDTLISTYGLEDSTRIIHLSIRRAQLTGGLNLIVARSIPIYRRVQETLPSISHTYLRLTREHGVLLLYGVKPRTGIYGVELDLSGGSIETKLTPVR